MDYPSEEALERIADAQWNGGKGEGIVFTDIYQHNPSNHTLFGSIEVDGEIYDFIIESGDWNGTVVKEWIGPELDTFDTIRCLCVFAKAGLV